IFLINVLITKGFFVRVRDLARTTKTVEIPPDFYDVSNNNKHYTTVIDTGAPETILPYYVKGCKGWSTKWHVAEGYGHPALQTKASDAFEVLIGDVNNNWSKWVQAEIKMWEHEPGDKMNYNLVRNDVMAVGICTKFIWIILLNNA